MQQEIQRKLVIMCDGRFSSVARIVGDGIVEDNAGLTEVVGEATLGKIKRSPCPARDPRREAHRSNVPRFARLESGALTNHERERPATVRPNPNDDAVARAIVDAEPRFERCFDTGEGHVGNARRAAVLKISAQNSLMDSLRGNDEEGQKLES
jgi:2-polyprenyl-6-methoxyphenol hydroxylase-like FAD-dependent oxidoreductase